MDRSKTTYGLVLCAMLLGGCTARELAWMVPRASVGIALRTHEGQIAGAGFVTLVSPLERISRPPRITGSGPPLRLLGPPTECAVREACRWEGHARSGALADLVEEEVSP